MDIQDDKALIISKYGLDAKKYNGEWQDVTWESCTLRKWLNEDFYNQAFSSKAENIILESEVTAEDNPEYGTSAGNSKKDKIFLLSISEAKTYFNSDEDRKCKATEYTIENGIFVNDDDGNCWWWLRSPGNDADRAACVNRLGAVDVYGYFVNSDTGGIRPALWINLES